MPGTNQTYPNVFDTINETGKEISLFAFGDINQLLPPEPSPSEELETLAINDADESFTDSEEPSLIESPVLTAGSDDEAEEPEEKVFRTFHRADRTSSQIAFLHVR